MSFYGLCNARVSIHRRQNIGQNEFGEIQFTDIIIASDIPCARQVFPGINANQGFEGMKEGDLSRKIVRYYFPYSEDIQEKDYIWFEASEQAEVRSCIDEAGRKHHKKVFAVEVEDTGEGDKTSG